jgi:hypothetical protein
MQTDEYFFNELQTQGARVQPHIPARGRSMWLHPRMSKTEQPRHRCQVRRSGDRRYPWTQLDPTLQSQTMFCILAAQPSSPMKQSRRHWRTITVIMAETKRRMPRLKRRPAKSRNHASPVNKGLDAMGPRACEAMIFWTSRSDAVLPKGFFVYAGGSGFAILRNWAR